MLATRDGLLHALPWRAAALACIAPTLTLTPPAFVLWRGEHRAVRARQEHPDQAHAPRPLPP